MKLLLNFPKEFLSRWANSWTIWIWKTNCDNTLNIYKLGKGKEEEFPRGAMKTGTDEFILYYCIKMKSVRLGKIRKKRVTMMSQETGFKSISLIFQTLRILILLWKWKVKGKSLSHVWLFLTPWTVAYQAPLSMGFSRQEYWSGVPLPSPGDPPDPGTEPRSPTL